MLQDSLWYGWCKKWKKKKKKIDKSLFSLPKGPLCLMTQRSSSSSIAGISMIEHYCCVKFINLKLLYRCSTRPPSSNRLNVWMLFELHGSTMTLSSGKCWLSHLSFTYLLCCCIWNIMVLISGRLYVFSHNFDTTVFTYIL